MNEFIKYDGHSFNVTWAKAAKKKKFIAQHKHFYDHLPEEEREVALGKAFDTITGTQEADPVIPVATDKN